MGLRMCIAVAVSAMLLAVPSDCPTLKKKSPCPPRQRGQGDEIEHIGRNQPS
jgi:hypothetical protein